MSYRVEEKRERREKGKREIRVRRGTESTKRADRGREYCGRDIYIYITLLLNRVMLLGKLQYSIK